MASLAHVLNRATWRVLEMCAVLSPFVTPLAVPGYARGFPAGPSTTPAPSTVPAGLTDALSLDRAHQTSVPGPAPGHPERLLPVGPLSEPERHLWGQLLEP
jgi:hypothetical protein